VARWGGEEFLIIARNSARIDAAILPERIRAAVDSHPFEIEESTPIHCTCSLGFSVFPLVPVDTEMFTWEQIVEIADTCLYAAKRNGRNAWIGIIPDATSLKGIPKEKIPKFPAEIAKTRIFPTLTSLTTPIEWEEE
jgi:predicted signal transduction protein with EAL and GGDEF domain